MVCRIPNSYLSSSKVRDGWFFNISEKTFVQNAIEGDDIGEITPRKFFPYTYSELSKPYVKE